MDRFEARISSSLTSRLVEKRFRKIETLVVFSFGQSAQSWINVRSPPECVDNTVNAVPDDKDV